MKLNLVLMAVALLMGGVAPTRAETPPGKQALPGADFELSAYEGKVVLLDFWASWCKPCRVSMPWLSRMQEVHGPEGLQVVAINLDTDLAAAAAMIEGFHEDMVLVHDPRGELAAQYKLEGMPMAFVYGRDGELAFRHLGFSAGETDMREAELKALLVREVVNEKE